MTRRMIINAQSPEELRIAIVSDAKLESYQMEVARSGLTRGNIYRGTISNLQPALNAAFVDYGAERNGFLPIQDVVPQARYRQPTGSGRPKIDDILERGKPIVVQIARDPVAQKGAALTTNLSLAGRYLVLTPFDDTRGVSRKVEDDETRRQLKELAAKLDLPEGCGVIVRTNALDQNRTVLQKDLAALLRLWKRIEGEARRGKGTKLLYSDQDLILRALRDLLDSSIQEVVVDDEDAYERAQEYLHAFLPRSRTQLVRYTERAPVFSRYDLEPQIEQIYKRQVPLPGGGSLVIDATEALTAIDVNSGKSTRAATQEETALNTNLEAAPEVARQLRLRDIGGLIVVDFIDMRSPKHRRQVEKAMRDAMKADRARSSVGRISSNGLLEINRQQIQQPLGVRTHRPCPTCEGTGRIASPELVSLNLLRRIEARAATGKLGRVRIELHPELADAFQNGRRQEIAALEREFDLAVEVIASPSLHRPEERIDWVERDAAAGAATPSAEPAVHVRELAAAGKADGPHPKKRRRRRSRSAGRGDAATSEESDGPSEAASETPASTRDDAAKEPPADDGEPAGDGSGGTGGAVKRGRRRRRGGRRRRRSTPQGSSEG